MYRPEELFFAVNYQDDSFCVHFLHRTWLNNEPNPIPDGDNLGKHNVDNNALRAAGLNIYENMENVFAVIEGDNREDIITRVEAAGFIYSQELQDQIDENYRRERE